jgi:hypothetical protein
MIIMEIGLGLVVFALVLLVITYASAFVADVTGMFRVLFIQKPYRQAFRLVRWLLAAVAAAGVFAAIE